MPDDEPGTSQGREHDFRRQLVVGTSGTLGLFILILALLNLAYGSTTSVPAILLSGFLLGIVAALVLVGRIAVDFGGHAMFGILWTLGIALIVAYQGQLVGVYIALPVMTLLAILIAPGRSWLVWVAGAIVLIGVGTWMTRSESVALLSVNDGWIYWAPYRMPFILSVLALIVGRHYVHIIMDLRQEAEESAERWQRVSARSAVQEQRFQALAGQAADWFWETDVEHRLTFVSAGVERCTGLTPDQVLGIRPDQVYTGYAGLDVVDSSEHLKPMDTRTPFRDQKLYWRLGEDRLIVMLNRGRPVYDANRQFAGFRGVVHDVTEEETLKKRLRDDAATDHLTRLASRQHFIEFGREILRESLGKHPASLLFIDLDHFKPVNDRGGHAAGDEMLVKVAAAIRNMTPNHQLCARLGGDEFCILLDETDLRRAKEIAESVLAAICSVRVQAHDEVFKVGASIGVASEDPVANVRLGNWIQAADEAAYEAKKEGRSQVRLSNWIAQ